MILYNIATLDWEMTSVQSAWMLQAPTHCGQWLRDVWEVTLKFFPARRMEAEAILRNMIPEPHGTAPAQEMGEPPPRPVDRPLRMGLTVDALPGDQAQPSAHPESRCCLARPGNRIFSLRS